ncbi:ANTAR domain-containing protein [Kineococcus sp. SYSU DK005]|uniref:ANTAR domain-containing protein n=1 Tax=Kineococcus sp. SYSU DK005 TaxID=3383126 RepID=UPI003D7EA987
MSEHLAPQRSAPTGTTRSLPAALSPQQAFAELGTLVVGHSPLGQVLHRTAALAAACVPGAEQVSITLLEGGSARSAAFTGALAATLDERQYEAGFGPCLHAAQSGQSIRIDDTTTEATTGTYRDFAATAARAGVRSTVSIGMPMPQPLTGAINVYRFDAGVLDEQALGLLQDFAGYAAIALANHALYASAADLNTHLRTAMTSRAVIEQAKGVLIAQLHCTPEEAFAHLVRRSQNTNRKLRQIAAEIVQRATGG